MSVERPSPEHRRVYDYARAASRGHVEDLLDDPSELLHPWRDQEPPAVIAELRQLATDLGADFDMLLACGSAFERERLAAIETGRIAAAPESEA